MSLPRQRLSYFCQKGGSSGVIFRWVWRKIKIHFPVILSVVLPRQTGEARGGIEGPHYAPEKY